MIIRIKEDRSTFQKTNCVRIVLKENILYLCILSDKKKNGG